MFRFALLIVLVLPVSALAADYIESSGRRVTCPADQAGNHYCVKTPPIEKLITDCDPGVDCHHMQSGQHYSVQSPINSSY